MSSNLTDVVLTQHWFRVPDYFAMSAKIGGPDQKKKKKKKESPATGICTQANGATSRGTTPILWRRAEGRVKAGAAQAGWNWITVRGIVGAKGHWSSGMILL